jgi:hypothetical protein
VQRGKVKKNTFKRRPLKFHKKLKIVIPPHRFSNGPSRGLPLTDLLSFVLCSSAHEGQVTGCVYSKFSNFVVTTGTDCSGRTDK